MTFQVVLRMAGRSADTVRTILHQKLGDDMEVMEIRQDITPTATLRQNIATYKAKIGKLRRTLELVHTDYDLPAHYTTRLGTLQKKKQLTHDDAALVEQLSNFAERAPQLARMRRFLIELPDDPAFTDLAFRRRLVLAQLDMKDMITHPEKIDATLLQAFAEYHTAYVYLFIQRFRAREQAADAFQKRLSELKQRLDVLDALDTLPLLGSPRAPQLTAELARLTHELTPTGLSDTAVRKLLTDEPTVRGISLVSPLPDADIESFVAALTHALGVKVRGITEAGVLQLLTDKKTSSAKTLSQLAALTKLGDITKLFTKKTTPALIQELATLLRAQHTNHPRRVTRTRARTS